MDRRFVGVVALVAIVVLTIASRSSWPSAMAQETTPATAPSVPRMFSPWYVEALNGILDLEEDDVARLEEQLAANPDDFPARLKLMAYHRRADRSGREEDRAKRVRHALWLVEHHPDSELLHSPVTRFSRREMTAAEFQRAVALWDVATKGRPDDAAVQWNAASFFTSLDPGLRMYYLEATVAADPNHPFALRPLAHLYARTILEGGPLASRAEAGLEASNNVWVLGNAAYMLQSLYNRGIQMGSPNPRAAELAEHYFLKAQALDPNLDRQKILPQLSAEMMARAGEIEREAIRAAQEWSARADEAVGRVRRLPVEAFDELPPAVAGVLRARGCMVPQPRPDGHPRNVIRGEFFARGEEGWAALCSVDNSTELLAFRNDHDTDPQTVTSSDDRGYLQFLNKDRVVYSRDITAVGRDFIMRHYRAYGGSEPPPIEHHGIDDAFLEKASITWYFHEGQWLRLTGAD